MDGRSNKSLFESDDYKKVTKKLSHGKYLPHEVPAVKEWMRQKEEEASQKTVMYNEELAPKGKEFLRGQAPQLEKEGWVDTPAKFGKDTRSKVRHTKRRLVSFWFRSWKWLVAPITAVIIAIISYLL